MATAWFDRKAGSDVHVSKDDDGVYLLGRGVPDWVATPEQLGGERLRVMGAFKDVCPMCGGGSPVRHLELTDSYFVAECVQHGFVWYIRQTH